jgi:hypothetical protein
VSPLGLPQLAGAWNPIKVIAECIVEWRAETTRRRRDQFAHELRLLDRMPDDLRAIHASQLLLSGNPMVLRDALLGRGLLGGRQAAGRPRPTR